MEGDDNDAQAMAAYPVLHYSKGDVRRAGKTLAAPIIWSDDPDRRAEILRTFRVAQDWRASHAYPLNRIRQELGAKLRKLGIEGITAGRIKRMTSIRKKLARSKTTLAQMQDLGGCRAILPTIADVAALARLYKDGGSKHKLWDQDDYITRPKSGGYRSVHMMLAFEGQGPDAARFHGRRIEIQLRTQLQHAWATAVEAVGLVRKEDLKAGEGSPDWLRLFALISSRFAAIEGCPIVPETSEIAKNRHAEIVDLEAKIGAVSTLQKLNKVFDIAESYSGRQSPYYLIQYDDQAHCVRVSQAFSAARGSDDYAAEEMTHEARNTVLVEIDRFENLKEAYPNYFLDVETFTAHLRAALADREEIDIGAVPTERGKPSHKWLKEYMSRKARR